jgi:cardiolipin synthase A/B
MAIRSATPRSDAEASTRPDVRHGRGPLGGLRRVVSRIRLGIWRGWLFFVAAAATADWKQWLAVLGLTVVTVIAAVAAPLEKSPSFGLDHEFPIDSAEFLATMAGATDTPVQAGNRIEVLNNGDRFYPAMLDAISGARRTVTVEAYIYWEGAIGTRFAEALAAKAREGVTVKILLDAVGSSTIGDDILATLEDGGCQVAWYRPVHWYSVERVNNRTHRKSLIVDGVVGFTGGAGIADQWVGDAENPDHWRDIQIRIEGPAVTPLQTGFARNWLESTGELVSGDAYYPPASPAGPYSAQSILSSPESGSSTVRLMYYLSIACARRSIFIANPYFVPDEVAVKALVDAKRRGVDVKVMITGEHNDNKIARHNSVRVYGDLLDAGIEIYEYDKTMMHQKYMVCDGLWTTIGTTNFDNRSFALNEENNVCVYDKGFAAGFEEIFRADLSGCKRVTPEAWRDRGLMQRGAELVASLVENQV